MESLIKVNEPINRQCTLKIGGVADYFFITICDLK